LQMTPQMPRPASAFALDVPDALLARLRRGDAVAFEQVYRWFERPVFTLALRICGDRERAADVLQDTMLKAFDRVGGFRGGGDAAGEAPFWAWLRRIAVNEALMTLRRRRADAVDDGFDAADALDPVDDVTPPPPAAADAAALQRALEALPAITRTVLWLYHAEGYTHEEIATLMQRTPSFSKSQLARGGRRLRALLDPAAPVSTDASLAVREAAHG